MCVAGGHWRRIGCSAVLDGLIARRPFSGVPVRWWQEAARVREWSLAQLARSVVISLDDLFPAAARLVSRGHAYVSAAGSWSPARLFDVSK